MRYVATIGSFDGVHRGHRCLLNQVRRIANEQGLAAMAITFKTSPKRVLNMGRLPQLNTAEQRISLLHQASMDEVVVLDFTPAMSTMSARDFMQQVLKNQLHVNILVIGYDHRFGHGRNEGFDDYIRYGQEMGIKIVRGEMCMEEGEPISSSRIRHLITKGEVDKAGRLLGYPYMLSGEVVDGYKEGRKMGFPTANIQVSNADELIPADGVYAVWVHVDKDIHKGMLNVGFRPTLSNGWERSIEVHILDFEGTLYGKHISVEFVHWLREERTFKNIEELTNQLRKDKERVQDWLESNKL